MNGQYSNPDAVGDAESSEHTGSKEDAGDGDEQEELGLGEQTEAAAESGANFGAFDSFIAW